jgi:hypothetical protein
LALDLSLLLVELGTREFEEVEAAAFWEGLALFRPALVWHASLGSVKTALTWTYWLAALVEILGHLSSLELLPSYYLLLFLAWLVPQTSGAALPVSCQSP